MPRSNTNSSTDTDIDLCQVPPDGWSCSRKMGHDGPCAVMPKTVDRWRVEAALDTPNVTAVTLQIGQEVVVYSDGTICNEYGTTLIRLVPVLHEGCERRGGVCDCAGRPCGLDPHLAKCAEATADKYTMSARLCDDDGMVSHAHRDGSVRGAILDSYLDYLNYLRQLTGPLGEHKPVEEPFSCTGNAHLAGEHIRCTSPAHGRGTES